LKLLAPSPLCRTLAFNSNLISNKNKITKEYIWFSALLHLTKYTGI
jgi:hypothetical protein